MEHEPVYGGKTKLSDESLEKAITLMKSMMGEGERMNLEGPIKAIGYGPCKECGRCVTNPSGGYFYSKIYEMEERSEWVCSGCQQDRR